MNCYNDAAYVLVKGDFVVIIRQYHKCSLIFFNVLNAYENEHLPLSQNNRCITLTSAMNLNDAVVCGICVLLYCLCVSVCLRETIG